MCAKMGQSSTFALINERKGIEKCSKCGKMKSVAWSFKHFTFINLNFIDKRMLMKVLKSGGFQRSRIEGFLMIIILVEWLE